MQKLVGYVRMSKYEGHCILSAVCKINRNYGQDLKTDDVF